MAAGMSRLLICAVVVGVSTTALLLFWRGFFWQHALIIGIAAAALVYTSVRTYERLRNLYKP